MMCTVTLPPSVQVGHMTLHKYHVIMCFPFVFQVVLVSATLPHEILEMTNKFMTDPIRILVKR